MEAGVFLGRQTYCWNEVMIKNEANDGGSIEILLWIFIISVSLQQLRDFEYPP